MLNHPTFSPSAFPPYAYFHPSNYLSNQIPFMNTTNSPNNLPSGTLFFPPELTNNAYFGNQMCPSPPPTSSLTRTNTNMQYQNRNRKTANNEQMSQSNDSSKTNYSTPFRSRPR
jgi:hypothetical protein